MLSSLTIFFNCCCSCGNRNNSQYSSEPPQNATKIGSLPLTLIFVLMLAQFCIGIYILATENGLKNTVRATTVDIFKNYNSSDTSFNELETKFKCCGLDGPDYWQGKLEPLPSSCCDPTTSLTCTLELAYAEGCLEKTAIYFIEQNRLLGWITIGFEIGKLALLFAICCLSSLVCTTSSVGRSVAISSVYHTNRVTISEVE